MADTDRVHEGEIVENGGLPAKPPGRKPVAPFGVIAPVRGDEAETIFDSPADMIAGRRTELWNWSAALLSTSPSKVQRVSFGASVQAKVWEKLYATAFNDGALRSDRGQEQVRSSTDAELMELLARVGIAVPNALPSSADSEQEPTS